jgi:multiple sugar transport system ATP-binding protein
MNFMSAEARDGTVSTSTFELAVPDLDLGASANSVETIGIRPEDLTIARDEGLVDGTISVFEKVGSYNLAYLDLDGIQHEVIAQIPSNQYYQPDDRVSVSVIDNRIHLFTDTGEAVYHPVIEDDRPENEAVQS